MIYKIFRLLMVFGLVISCQDEKKTKEIPLHFEKKTIEKKAGKNCDTAEYDCTIISLEVVRVKGSGKVAENINKALQEHVIQIVSSEEDPQITNLEELTSSFIANYRKAAEEFSQEPPWEAYLNESIYRKDDHLISIGITIELFTGGAHGYKSLHFLNFDPQTGKTLSWKDIFTPAFKKYAEKKFREEQGIPPHENINSTGFWFENDVFRLPANLGFTEKHVILVYNSYEIAPFSAGDIYLEIPIEEVRPFLKIE